MGRDPASGTRAFLAVLLLAACTKDAPPNGGLLAQVRQALADRDARLSSYHLVAETTQSSQQLTHEFFFRSPNKMRAVVSGPPQQQSSFDGRRLYKLQPETKTLSTFELKLPPAKAAMFLHSTFAPFVLEGFRTPLMPIKGVTATPVAHPKGPQAVELTIAPGEGVMVTYVLRWPGADFLERRAGASALKVDEEHCDPTLKLCVPKVAAELIDGKKVVTVRLTTIELNPALRAEDFAPGLPAGWTAETRQVVEDTP